MIKEKTFDKYRREIILEHIDEIKCYYETKKAKCYSGKRDEYEFSYSLVWREKLLSIQAIFDLTLDDAKITIRVVGIEKEDSIYEIDEIFDNCFSEIFSILLKGKDKYVVRIYGRYYAEHPFEWNDYFNWKNAVRLFAYEIKGRHEVFNVETITACPKEQLMYCDIEVYSYNLSAARTIAYNLFLEFCVELSVLLDIGIEPYNTRENIVLVDIPNDVGNGSYTLYETIVSSGFDDTELNLFVFDNMNGLVAVDDENRMILNDYNFLGSENGFITSSSYNKVLDDIFRKREIDKSKSVSIKNERINKEISYYNMNHELVSEHFSFFRKIKKFEEQHKEKFVYFLNACKLYNHAHCYCALSPTSMISYFISAIETLSKTEKTESYMKECSSDMDKFINFCKKYSVKKEFDVNFFKYIYGKIRSGHFHAGETQFFEYDCNLDLAFCGDFFEKEKIYIRTREELRYIFIEWIEKNILQV